MDDGSDRAALAKVEGALDRWKDRAEIEWKRANAAESSLRVLAEAIAMASRIARSILNRTPSVPFPTPGEKAALEELTQPASALASHLSAEREAMLAELGALKDAADSVVFHQLDCLGGCHESMTSLARLAKLINYKSNPATEEEIEEALKAPPDAGKTHECYRAEREAERAVVEAARKFVNCPQNGLDHEVDAESLAQAEDDLYAKVDEYEALAALPASPPGQHATDLPEL